MSIVIVLLTMLVSVSATYRASRNDLEDFFELSDTLGGVDRIRCCRWYMTVDDRKSWRKKANMTPRLPHKGIIVEQGGKTITNDVSCLLGTVFLTHQEALLTLSFHALGTLFNLRKHHRSKAEPILPAQHPLRPPLVSLEPFILPSLRFSFSRINPVN